MEQLWGLKVTSYNFRLFACHLCAKKYQSWWKFDEVMTKIILLSFWDTVL